MAKQVQLAADTLPSKSSNEMQIESHEEGHERQLRITFNLWSTLGLVYSITATPFGVGSYLTFSLILGGSPFYIYGYIFAVTFNIVLCVALAEISSIYPHPSGTSRGSMAYFGEHGLTSRRQQAIFTGSGRWLQIDGRNLSVTGLEP